MPTPTEAPLSSFQIDIFCVFSILLLIPRYLS